MNTGLPVTLRPQVEPLRVVQEELPFAGASMPHEQKRHRRLEWSEARVVYRSRLIALVVRPEEDSVSMYDETARCFRTSSKTPWARSGDKSVKTTAMTL